MTVSSRLLVSPAKAIALTAAVVVAIAIILLAPNITITNAQQQLPTSQPSVTQNPTLLSAKDSFRVQLPEGWVIQDVNNTGFTLAAEVTQGYGIIAELCPEGEEGQQQGALANVSSSSSNSSSSSRSCQQQQQAQEEMIHIIRYPNLGARLAI